MCQSMEGSVNGKCGKMCSITTKFGIGNKKTLYAYGILIWRLQFKKWKCKLPKNWDYGLGFSSSRFRNCAKNWSVTNCTNSHTLGQKMEKEHTESKGLPQCEIMASTIPKNIIMFSHCVHKHHQCYVVLKRITKVNFVNIHLPETKNSKSSHNWCKFLNSNATMMALLLLLTLQMQSGCCLHLLN